MQVRLRFQYGCCCIVSIAPSTLLRIWPSELTYCVMKCDWGQGGWTGPIVCWGEGVTEGRRFRLLEGGSPLWRERKKRRAGQSQLLGMRVELEWPTPRIRWLLNRYPVQDLLCEGQAWWILQNLWCWIVWPFSHTVPSCCTENFDAISLFLANSGATHWHYKTQRSLLFLILEDDGIKKTILQHFFFLFTEICFVLFAGLHLLLPLLPGVWSPLAISIWTCSLELMQHH